jgi:serine/threonine protein kinase
MEAANDSQHDVTIDRLADEFEGRWRQGDRPAVREFLRQAPEPARAALLRELVQIEFECRWRVGQRPAPGDYYREFPELAQPQSASHLDLEQLRMKLDSRDSNAPTVEPSAGAPSHADDEPQLPPPQRIGKYLVTAEIARNSGQAVVYRAVHPTLGVDVAIKLCKAPGESSAASSESLAKEGRILADLHHPNIARVFDLDVHEGRPFLAMEFVRGRNLVQYRQAGRIEPRRVAQVVAAIARALASAHRAGVVHLDVKPANIVVDHTDRPKLLDFGLSEATGAWVEQTGRPGVLRGTVPYMSPEQARGDADQIGACSDIFSLGAVLFYLITGKAPYHGQPMDALLQRVRTGEHDRELLTQADAPAALKAICTRAMQASPGDRYADADQFACALERFARWRAARRWIIAAAVGLVVLAAAWLYSLRPDINPLPQPMQLEVYRGAAGWVPIADASAAATGEKVRAQIRVEPGFHASLFNFASDGKLRKLQVLGPGDQQRTLIYEDVLNGPAGTELIVACARRSAPIDPDEVRASLPDHEPWPHLPMQSVLRLSADKVESISGERGFGDPNDPLGGVRQRMQTMHKSLQIRFAGSGAIAFPHLETLPR